VRVAIVVGQGAHEGGNGDAIFRGRRDDLAASPAGRTPSTLRIGIKEEIGQGGAARIGVLDSDPGIAPDDAPGAPQRRR